MIGLQTCENAIEEARYLQASALLRQEMEILAQLGAVREGRRKSNNSPNVTALETSLRRSMATSRRRRMRPDTILLKG